MSDAVGAALALGGDYALPGFPGQSRTLADLYYNRHRDYDTTAGRYIQADPIGLAGGSNPYVYADGNPLRYIDPMGLNPGAAVAGGAALGEGLTMLCLRFPTQCMATIGSAAIWVANAMRPKNGQKDWTKIGDYTCPDDDDDGPCETQKKEDERECNQWNITGARYGYSKKEGYKICMNTVAERYSECRGRGQNPRNITTQLFLPTNRRGRGEPTRY